MKSRNFIYTILNIVLMAGLFLWLQSCNKRDPNPELKDAIFKDLNDELALAKAELEKQQAEKASLQQELKNAPPQTGLAKTFQFKIENAADAETFYAQKKRFFEIRVEERKIYVQKRYLESLLPNGRKWPDPEEEEQYKLKLKFMRAKLALS